MYTHWKYLSPLPYLHKNEDFSDTIPDLAGHLEVSFKLARQEQYVFI